MAFLLIALLNMAGFAFNIAAFAADPNPANILFAIVNALCSVWMISYWVES